MRYFGSLILVLLCLLNVGFGSCNQDRCYVCPDLSGFVLGVQGGWSHLLTPDVRDRTSDPGLRGYERWSSS